ncbi:cytochrome b [Trabulsiella odontotermitis]|uniref:cytochrome b n=1 Tax=Trabulsiella odontotermitis TaxID=379893 RepID=UPI0006765B46|nr:cytochrome b/b6 domain-containing protein [Trabulsiella odontotermitis]KNC92078.1 cytochrome B561 [Trabulsiella odontotermitis]
MKPVTHFHPALRLLHWLMAAAILAMLFIGVAMVATVSSLHSLLVAIHKPLGLMILVLVVVRLGLRFSTATPPLPESLPAWQRVAAQASHWALYAMMLAQPLIGWAVLYAILRPLHSLVALVLFATVMLHLAAALRHALVLRDGVFESMSGTRRR